VSMIKATSPPGGGWRRPEQSVAHEIGKQHEHNVRHGRMQWPG
jgi:hypothetical protein